ncbi:MAG TPA: PIN domain-containing protein [Nitrososphaerales archaeon]|nr:PIN domain-containing protein [Nitrososphaerales archaeon]
MIFDTRFFWAVFTSRDDRTKMKLRALFERERVAYVSSISLYEVFKQTLINEDKDVARLRVGTMRRDFEVIDVDPDIAEVGAEISHRLRIPMADSLIMATAKRLGTPCVTDDQHFSEVRRIWI